MSVRSPEEITEKLQQGLSQFPEMAQVVQDLFESMTLQEAINVAQATDSETRTRIAGRVQMLMELGFIFTVGERDA